MLGWSGVFRRELTHTKSMALVWEFVSVFTLARKKCSFLLLREKYPQVWIHHQSSGVAVKKWPMNSYVQQNNVENSSWYAPKCSQDRGNVGKRVLVVFQVWTTQSTYPEKGSVEVRRKHSRRAFLQWALRKTVVRSGMGKSLPVCFNKTVVCWERRKSLLACFNIHILGESAHEESPRVEFLLGMRVVCTSADVPWCHCTNNKHWGRNRISALRISPLTQTSLFYPLFSAHFAKRPSILRHSAHSHLSKFWSVAWSEYVQLKIGPYLKHFENHIPNCASCSLNSKFG